MRQFKIRGFLTYVQFIVDVAAPKLVHLNVSAMKCAEEETGPQHHTFTVYTLWKGHMLIK
jgi:hypothetical protein